MCVLLGSCALKHVKPNPLKHVKPKHALTMLPRSCTCAASLIALSHLGVLDTNVFRLGVTDASSFCRHAFSLSLKRGIGVILVIPLLHL